MKKGFTLIELLVVIAIIAILAAILFPVFAQAREKARASSCLSNCKQIGTALQLYADDYDETIPSQLSDNSWTYISTFSAVTSGDWVKEYPGYFFERYLSQWSSFYAGAWSWMDQTYPYVKNINMFICPSGPKTKCYGQRNPANKYVTGLPGYGYNACIMNRAHNNNNGVAAISLSSLKSPSTLIFVGDSPYTDDGGVASMELGPFAYSGNVDNWKTFSGMSWCYPNASTAKWNKDLGLKHINGANFVFCDGHAKYYKKSNSANEGPCYFNGGENCGNGQKFWDPNVD